MPKTAEKKKYKKVAGIKTPGEAADALSECERLTAEAEALMEEHGITQKLADAAEKKKAATEWAVANEVQSIPISKNRYFSLRKDTYNKRVVGDTDELAELKSPLNVIPLKQIIKDKFGKGWQEVWKSVTTRRVDLTKLEQAVKNEVLTVDEIAPAYTHDVKAPYLRGYGK